MVKEGVAKIGDLGCAKELEEGTDVKRVETEANQQDESGLS